MCWSEATRIPADDTGPAAGRRFVGELIAQHYDASDELASDIAVIVSELLTNAVQAGGRDVRVEVHGHRREVRISVTDDAGGTPRLRTAQQDDERGRGLAIIAATSREWGVQEHGAAKTVFAIVDVAEAQTSDFDCAGPRY